MCERPCKGRSKRSALRLLLGTDVTVVSTLTLAAVSSLEREACVALTADHLVAFVFSGKRCKSGFNFNCSETTTAETQDEMES